MVDDAEKIDAPNRDAYRLRFQSQSEQDEDVGFQRRELSGQTEIDG
jgi:hypothetical protein